MSKVKLNDVAIEAKVKYEAIEGAPIRTVGLEHLTPSDIDLRDYATGAETTFTKGFSKGDILFGRRRAYQKKAAVAPFDGVCSGDITVIRAIDGAINKNLLPFIVQNDYFFDYAMGNSAGSMSPRVKWARLGEFEFELPSSRRQDELADLMWAIQETRRDYKAIVEECGNVIKSRFIEMFGGASLPTVKAGDVFLSLRNGLSPSKSGAFHAKVLTLSAITQGGFDAESWKDGTFKEEPPEDKRVSKDDLYICRGNGNKALVGTVEFAKTSLPDLVFPDTMIAGKIDATKVNMQYLCAAWKQLAVRDQIEAKARTTNGTYKINQEIVAEIKLPLPPLPLQEEFAAFVEQVDKLEFDTRKALESLNAISNAILNEELGLTHG